MDEADRAQAEELNVKITQGVRLDVQGSAALRT